MPIWHKRFQTDFQKDCLTKNIYFLLDLVKYVIVALAISSILVYNYAHSKTYIYLKNIISLRFVNMALVQLLLYWALFT